MPWIMQMVWFVLIFLGIAIALWVSVWLLVLIFVLSVGSIIYRHARDFLVARGILNPTPGVPPEEASPVNEITVIEGDFTHVETTEKSKIE